jgi:hypothetical protein
MTPPVLLAISSQSVMDNIRVRTFRDRYVAQDLPTRVAGAVVDASIDTVGPVARLDGVVEAVIALHRNGFRPFASKSVQVR